MPNLVGTRWNQNGGSTVVTWSIADAGLPGVRETFETNRSDFTTAIDATFTYDAEQVLQQAFAAWERIANIDFVQVVDQGERIGSGFGADIRVSFGQLDGAAGDTLGLAYFPANGIFAPAGDILFDAEETAFFANKSRFLSVSTHEIGHSIGLDHITTVNALMNPRISAATAPLADDIEGARQIYGANTSNIGAIQLNNRQPDLDILTKHDGLRVIGTSAANDIRGGKGGETLIGAGGADMLMGRGGRDEIKGGGGQDQIAGGGGADMLYGGGNKDVLLGNGGADMMVGGGNSDTIFGGGGTDAIMGNGGADILEGGGGNDTLTGGGGADRFVFAALKGRDVITDFKPGMDLIDFSDHGGVDGLRDLRLTSTSGNTIISDGGSGRIVLEDVDRGDLDAGDFIF